MMIFLHFAHLYAITAPPENGLPPESRLEDNTKADLLKKDRAATTHGFFVHEILSRL